jgi:hypothetical protein
MRLGEYYTIQDLANASGERIDIVARELNCLSNHGLIERLVLRDSLFKRRQRSHLLDPEEKRELLTLLADQLVEELRTSEQSSRFSR